MIGQLQISFMEGQPHRNHTDIMPCFYNKLNIAWLPEVPGQELDDEIVLNLINTLGKLFFQKFRGQTYRKPSK